MSDLVSKITAHLKITLNPMQESALKTIPAKDETILLSPTGSGKTIAFLLPALLGINPRIPKVQVLVVAPSRELAIQIEQVFKSMNTGYKVNSAYGGHSMKIEKQNLSQPPMVLIGTPGRIADHIDRGTFDTGSVHTIVLDEFDKSLEFGFSKEMGFILRKLDAVKKKILTSATHMDEIPAFTRIKSPVTLDYVHNAKPVALSLKKIISPERDKLNTLYDLLCYIGNDSALVFVNHREPTERISQFLHDKSIVNDPFHGGME
ncbi:MAG TPA: DEAD/DEAH box helicase, partial [Flavobacteriales bacterium]|nr:DEAD/DEAH box helicase [Flavobacteriales bacterium]